MMLGARLGAWAKSGGMPQPPGAVYVEYVESNALRGFMVVPPADMVRLDIDITLIGFPASGSAKFAGSGFNQTMGDDLGVIQRSGVWCFNNRDEFPCDSGTKYHVASDSSDGSLIVDGLKRTGILTRFWTQVRSGKNICIFSGTNGTNPYVTTTGNYQAAKCRIYSVMLEGATKISLMPCKLLSNGAGCFYDIESGSFYGATGGYVAGPELTA